jgi:WD40 repeat protein
MPYTFPLAAASGRSFLVLLQGTAIRSINNCTEIMQTALTYQGHSDNIFAVAWSPDGYYVASGGRDRTIQIWEPAQGQPLLTFRQHPGYVLSLSWSPEGAYIASGCTEGVIYVWEAMTGRILISYKGHTRFVRSLAWSPDGRLIASGGDYGDSTVQVWEVATSQLHYTHRQQYRIFSVCWLPASRRVASCSFDGSIQIWDALSGAHNLAFRGHTGPIYALACSPDGAAIASGGQDSSVMIWSPITGQTDAVYQGHSRPVKALAWAADGLYLASGGDDNTILVWSAATGNVIATSDHYATWIRSLSWSPANRCMAAAIGSSITIFDDILSINEQTKNI